MHGPEEKQEEEEVPKSQSEMLAERDHDSFFAHTEPVQEEQQPSESGEEK